MKKAIKVYGVYLLILVFFGACEDEHFLITGVDFNGATLRNLGTEPQFNNFNWTDTFTNDIVFIVSYHNEYQYGMNSNFSNKAYAQFHPGSVDDNYIIESSFSIKLDRAF